MQAEILMGRESSSEKEKTLCMLLTLYYIMIAFDAPEASSIFSFYSNVLKSLLFQVP